MSEMAKAYEPQGVEDALYKLWMESGYFNPDNLSGDPYTIMMPPPNVTGVLHLGHALENSLMDAMARYQRLQGKKVLLVPGTDHAAIATQAKVEKLLMKEGIKNPRQKLGREKLIEKIREFAEDSKTTILSQIKKVGTSADWSRLAYTFDDERNQAVRELFVRMHNDGLIYRGYRVVNWTVKGQSTCSDDEIVHVERPAKLYTFKYGKDFPITISTTRPETKLGDTAVAVHPSDERYSQYVGQTFTVDVGAAEPLSIRIIADEGVEKDFGTGALGVTPAHSAVDFAMYEKTKASSEPIGIIPVIGADGRMMTAAGEGYVGLTVEEARERFVGWLKENGLLIEEKEIVQSVGTSDRYGDVIEAIPMTQWWLDMNKNIPKRNKTLRDLMREAVTTGLGGDESQKVTITPDRFTKLYLDRVGNLRDWCLSRQLWWGHRIPAWYRGDEIFVGTETPEGEGWMQDEDTLDTWFSSGSWTFSTLGWPKKTKDLETFHPTSWMTMGYEILYLWLMRMILMSTYALEEIPFKDAYIHGILRDEHGQKFSKSSGNGVDPIDVINQYGCDALRLSVLTGISPGQDARYSKEKIEGARNLVNKVWNISRYVFMTTGGAEHVEQAPAQTLADRWILGRFAETAKKVSELMERFEFSLAAEVLRDFTWNDFADWYLEIAKIEGEKNDILNYLLERLLILWHPFMPFVTEEVYKHYDQGLIIVAKWPKVPGALATEDAKAVAALQGIITRIRDYRSAYQLKEIGVKILGGTQFIDDNRAIIAGLAKVSDLTMGSAEGGNDDISSISVCFILPEGFDASKQLEKLNKEIAALKKYISSVTGKLANANFVANAPAVVVEIEKNKLAEAEAKLKALKEQLKTLMS